MEFLGFSMYTVMSSSNSDSFISSHTIWIPIISFTCQIALARTSIPCWIKSSKDGHFSLVHDIRWKGFSFFTGRLGLCFSLLCELFWVWYPSKTSLSDCYNPVGLKNASPQATRARWSRRAPCVVCVYLPALKQGSSRVQGGSCLSDLAGHW